LDSEKISLIRELCYILNKRNNINARRNKARWRKSYWQKAIKVVEAFKGDSSELRKLNKQVQERYSREDVSHLEKRLNDISIRMHSVRQEWNNSHNSLPKKWIAMGPMKLRALVLKAEAEYSKAKYDTMVLSEKTTKKVKAILKDLDCFINYDNGYVTSITSYEVHPRQWKTQNFIHTELAIDMATIAKYAKEHELNKAIETLLKD
jgi:hypothetical protein